MMTIEEEIESAFRDFSIVFEGKDLMKKMKDLCNQYGLAPLDFAVEYMAFTMQQKLASNILTMDKLLSVEQCLNKKTLANDQGKKRLGTPTLGSAKRQVGLTHTPIRTSMLELSSPVSNPSSKYDNRTNRGECVQSWGDINSVTSWGSICKEPVKVQVLTPLDSYKFMFQQMYEKAEVIDSVITSMESFLIKHLDLTEFFPVKEQFQEPSCVLGRICCDSNGRLNASSVLLQGSRKRSAGRCVPLDLSAINNFSLFPGQVVAVKGVNSTGSKLVVQQIFDNAALPLKCPLTGNLSICVVCGPFCTGDTLSLQPLHDLLKDVANQPPDVLILNGPFVDSKILQLEKKLLDTTFDDFFLLQMKTVYEAVKSSKTQVILVPSYRDLHHDMVYPQPPYHFDSRHYPNIHLVSDPCTLLINDVIIGLTSTDILMHLGAEETGSAGSGDRMTRLVEHIINQHNYYPVEPPHEDINIDWEHFESVAYWQFTPNILILCSDLKPFMKKLSDCFCINPGRLTKGHTGGTFAKVQVVTRISSATDITATINKI